MDRTPPPRQKNLAVTPTPQSGRLSLLASFGAMSSPTSVSKMRKQQEAEFDNMARSETPASNASYMPSPSTAQETDSLGGAEDSSSEDVIHAVPRGTMPNLATPSRQLPPRSARQTTSYAPLPRSLKKPKSSGHRVFLSNTAGAAPRPKTPAKPSTARGQIRQDIALYTKPKRDAFFLAKKEFFLPLLPENNYISKLEAQSALSEDSEQTGIIPRKTLLPQPQGITATLKPYQREGLTFLVHMYQNGMSAILGDEMGLGKTLQTLSLFQHLKLIEPNSAGETRPFLVICPLSVLSSWANEAAKWTPDFKVIRFHGPKVERERMKQEAIGVIDRYGSKTGKSTSRKKTKTADVIDLTENEQPVDLVITTYEAFVTEQGWFKRAFAWRYVVADEGHKLKNEKSDVSRALQTIRAEYRLLLTGTPLQNNLQELWALLHWLIPEVFTDETSMSFKLAFDLTKGKASTSFMDNARRLLELVMLRRMKNSQGVNLGLPPKEEILLYVPLTPLQKFWYTRLLTKADNLLLEDLFRDSKPKTKRDIEQEQADDEELSMLQHAAEASGDVWAESKELVTNVLKSGSQQRNEYQKLMALVIQLRKACSHPYLLPGAMPEPYSIGGHVRIASGKFIVLEKLLQELVVKQGKKVLIFSGWTKTLDMIEDLLTFMRTVTGPSAFKSLRFDGSTARARRNLTIRMFNDQQSDFKIMLISTRAGGLGINLTSATDVIFMDEDWNPQITLQAEARAHRIGQTKKVTVYKLCSQGTVEEQMMGRIRKKLYLSAKITESMRNLHTAEQTPKRKRGSNKTEKDDAPQLGTSELKTLLRRGAQTLSGPQINVDELLAWDLETTVENCRDRPQDPLVADSKVQTEIDEDTWLNNAETVETAIFEGKRHHRQLEEEAKTAAELVRADRRANKNTTVMVDGFAISKESMGCADWEAVPTLAGNPRLAEPVRAKKDSIQSQEHCQACWDGGELFCCPGCPRAYHLKCLDPQTQAKAKASFGTFRCAQHHCFDCEKKTADAGGLIFRCRWCEKGYCEECMDWDTVNLLGESLPEMELLNYYPSNGWYIECQACVENWKQNPGDYIEVQKEKARIEKEYREISMAAVPTGGAMYDSGTPTTWSEAETPADGAPPSPKKQKTSLLERMSSSG